MQRLKIVFVFTLNYLLISCGSGSSEISNGYSTPSCSDGQYYDGSAGECTALVSSLEFDAAFINADEEELAFRDSDFDLRLATITNFIDSYISKHLSTLTLTNPVTCTAGMEANINYSEGYFNNWLSTNCAFTLSEGATKVLDLVFDETVKDSQYLKILHHPVENRFVLTLCTVGEIDSVKYTVTDSVLAIEDEKITGTASCEYIGMSPYLDSNFALDNAALQALPRTIFQYLSNTQTAPTIVTSGTNQIDYALTQITNLTTLAITCDSTAFNMTVALTTGNESPTKGTIEISAFDSTNFFKVTALTTEDEEKYNQGRSLLGCSTKACFDTLMEEKQSYSFLGNTITINDEITWNIATGSVTSLAAGNDAACTLIYTEDTSI